MVRLRRYNVENLAYLITTSAFLNRPSLLTNQRAETVADYIYRARPDLIQYLLAFAIMPSHMHILFVPQPGVTISGVLHYIKRGSARVIQAQEKTTGRLWTRRFHDQGIRTEEQLRESIEYIHNNPVKAGMVKEAEEYLWSSANSRWKTDVDLYLVPR